MYTFSFACLFFFLSVSRAQKEKKNGENTVMAAIVIQYHWQDVRLLCPFTQSNRGGRASYVLHGFHWNTIKGSIFKGCSAKRSIVCPVIRICCSCYTIFLLTIHSPAHYTSVRAPGPATLWNHKMVQSTFPPQSMLQACNGRAPTSGRPGAPPQGLSVDIIDSMQVNRFPKMIFTGIITDFSKPH